MIKLAKGRKNLWVNQGCPSKDRPWHAKWYAGQQFCLEIIASCTAQAIRQTKRQITYRLDPSRFWIFASWKKNPLHFLALESKIFWGCLQHHTLWSFRGQKRQLWLLIPLVDSLIRFEVFRAAFQAWVTCEITSSLAHHRRFLSISIHGPCSWCSRQDWWSVNKLLSGRPAQSAPHL